MIGNGAAGMETEVIIVGGNDTPPSYSWVVADAAVVCFLWGQVVAQCLSIMTRLLSYTSTPRGGVASMPRALGKTSAPRAPSVLTRLYKHANPGHGFVHLFTAISFSFSFLFLEQ